MSRVRNIVFTLNNYTDEDIRHLAEISDVRYMVYGYEVAPSTGTPHLQGYIQFAKLVSLSVLGRMLPWHIQPAKGNFQQNYDYVTKSGEFTEIGIPKAQGRRNDIHRVLDYVKEGKNMREIIPECSNYQSVRMAEKLLYYYELPRSSEVPTFSYWIYGGAGIGKTYFARKILGKDAYVKGAGKFWNSYDGHENVLIDDFRKTFFDFEQLLLILDRYPMVIETKGGSRQLKAKLIVITSDRPPWDIWRLNDLDQVMRRLAMCITIRKFF